MPSNIYNEGRVVGYSAYEVYVRHALSIDPNTQPASELEWLSSSIAMGTSMILKINADAALGHHFQEITLPANTRLAAANTIIGSLFLGDVALDSSGRWATKVTSYGPLIENNAEHPPVGSQDPQRWSTYPLAIHDDIDMSVYKNKLKEYIKVVDGIVIQPGTWSNSASGTPPKDFSDPRLDGSPKVRILLSDNVSSPFYILLTGFTLGTVLKGVTGMDGSTDTSSPQDGDFLGPAVYPWANKIVFSVPPAYVRYYLNNMYSRVLGTSPLAVNRVPVIDMEATDPATYYGSNYTSNPINFTVTESNSVNGDAVLTVYQRSNILPPALYGTKVDAAGSYKLCPIDTTAPGTVKIFEDTNRKAEASAVNNIPGNVGMSRDANYILYQSTQNVGNQTMESDPVADTSVDELQQERTGGTGPLALTTTTGKKSNFAVSLVDTNGDELVRTGINIPFPSRNCYAENTDDNLMIPVEDKPSDWENGYMRNTYFQKVGTPFNGNGVTTTFTFPTAVAPDSILRVTVTINEVAYIQNDWSYNTSTKELTITPAPANGSVIDAYDDFASEATFETINPIYDTSFPNSEPNLKRKGTLHWDDLMYALANNCAIDLFDNDYFLECVKSRLFAGLGISIGETTKTIDGQQIKGLEVINTDPNIANGVGYTTLTQDGPFKSVGYNGFVTDTTAPPSQTHPKLTVKILPSKSLRNYAYTSGGTTTTVQIPQSLNIIVNDSSSNGYTLKKFQYDQAAIQDPNPPITKRGFYTGIYYANGDYWDNNELPGFHFYHDEGVYSTRGQYSWLFGIQFRAVGNVTLVDGTQINMNHIKAAIEDGTYKFQNTSKGSSGIWNVSIVGNNTSPRASWGALTNVVRGFTPGAPPTFRYHDEATPGSGDTSLDSHIIAAVASYEDGYNAQFDKYNQVIEDILGQTYQDSNGAMLWSNHINVSVSCMFYID